MDEEEDSSTPASRLRLAAVEGGEIGLDRRFPALKALKKAKVSCSGGDESTFRNMRGPLRANGLLKGWTVTSLDIGGTRWQRQGASHAFQ